MAILSDILSDASRLLTPKPEKNVIYEDFMNLCAPGVHVHVAQGYIGLGMGTYR